MFEIEGEEGAARAGLLHTAHGTVPTPAFMPVGTNATVKTLAPEEVRRAGASAIISNSLILALRPGLEVIEAHGGLHRFMQWDHTIFSDSGGFQMIRRDFLVGVDDDGITFKSPFDGRTQLFTPQRSMEVQSRLGSDVAMVLDHCPPWDADEEEVAGAMRHTLDWAQRSLQAHERHFPDRASSHRQLVFAIVQGGTDPLSRKENAAALAALGFDGYGIGGLCIGEPKPEMYAAIDASMPQLPKDRPRYLMGVGSPRDVVEAIARGVDIFDSVYPTRNARHNTALVWPYPEEERSRPWRLNFTKARFRSDRRPLDPTCSCPTCARYSRSYLRHLARANELLVMRLVSYHNIYLLQRLVKNVRAAILDGRFETLREELRQRADESRT